MTGGSFCGIAAIRPGGTIGDIGAAIQTFVEAQHMNVVRDFCGHGLGRLFHDEPNIVHVGAPRRGDGVQAWHVIHRGAHDLGRPHVKVLSDGWTAVTRDRSLSAQFEHTVGVIDSGVETFTLSPRGLDRPPDKSADPFPLRAPLRYRLWCFGNCGPASDAGVAFSRDPSTGGAHPFPFPVSPPNR
jgi:hypothetical protein